MLTNEPNDSSTGAPRDATHPQPSGIWNNDPVTRRPTIHPQWAELVMFGMNPVQVGIAAVLAEEKGAATTLTLQERLGSSRSTLFRHLDALEEAGLISCTLPPDRRHGRDVAWKLNTAELLAQLDNLRQRLTPVADS